MPSSHLILCCPFLLLPPIPPSIRVFSNESTLRMRWPKYWSFSFSIIQTRKCKKKKRRRRHPEWKERNKTFSTCRQHACLCCKCQGMYKNHLELISEFRKMAGYKVTVQMYFYMLMTFKWKPKLKIPHRIAPKK